MRRVVLSAAAALALGGCASFSVPGLDVFTPAPATVTLQLESVPSGAEARLSGGASCRTPCVLPTPAVPTTVTFTLDRYQPQSVNLQPMQRDVTRGADDDFTSSSSVDLQPNPVFAELQPLVLQRRPPKRPPAKRAKRPPPAAAGAASPFPPPPR
jgi:hypothetical protein